MVGGPRISDPALLADQRAAAETIVSRWAEVMRRCVTSAVPACVTQLT